jgi:nucleotide-binding universal stress UspA family protein
MRRVVVPLDGTALATAILPDARRVAGPDGELILVNAVELFPFWDTARLRQQRKAVDASRDYLREVADRLRGDEVKVEVQTMVADNVAQAIDEAAMVFDADVIAVATHGLSPLGRLLRGSIAWLALAHSPVPVLIRHVLEGDGEPLPPKRPERRLMVPLDGSTLAEKVLPLAHDLATEWAASIWLVHVISKYPVSGFPRTEVDSEALTQEEAHRSSQQYLDRMAAGLGGDVHTHVITGTPSDELAGAAAAWDITDIAISSHGRTGLSRVIVGSVTDALIHRTELPIIVVPALATESVDQGTPSAEPAAADHSARSA